MRHLHKTGETWAILTKVDYEDPMLDVFETFEEAQAFFRYGVNQALEMDDLEKDDLGHTLDEIVEWHHHAEIGPMETTLYRADKVQYR